MNTVGGFAMYALLLVPNALLARLFLKQPISRGFAGGSAIAIAGIVLLLAVAGALDLSGLTLELNLPTEPPAVGSYTLITAAGGIQGVFEQASVAKPWRLVVEPTAVRLTYVSGTLMLLQ